VRANGEIATRVLNEFYGADDMSSGRESRRVPLGFAAPGCVLGLEDPDAAWEFLRDSRSLALRSGVPAYEADLILACAILWVHDGDPARAARLLSWVRARTISAGSIPTPGDYVLYLHYRKIVRDALGPEESRRARTDGALMPIDEALALAFDERVRP